MKDDKRELKWFFGTADKWCEFVNKNGITQEQISSCNPYVANGHPYVYALYWI